MSCLTAFLNSRARVYDVDRSEKTDSGQPLESLSLVKTIKIYFAPQNINDKVYQLFNPGRIKTGDYICLSLKSLELGQVLAVEIQNYENFIIKNIHPLKYGKKTLGYNFSVERYKH